MTIEERVKGWIRDVKSEPTEEGAIQQAFNRAANVIKALNALAAETGGKLEITARPCSWDPDGVVIWTNIGTRDVYGRMYIDLKLLVSKSGIINCTAVGDGKKLSTWGTSNYFAVKKAVKYVAREARLANKL